MTPIYSSRKSFIFSAAKCRDFAEYHVLIRGRALSSHSYRAYLLRRDFTERSIHKWFIEKYLVSTLVALLINKSVPSTHVPTKFNDHVRESPPCHSMSILRPAAPRQIPDATNVEHIPQNTCDIENATTSGNKGRSCLTTTRSRTTSK